MRQIKSAKLIIEKLSMRPFARCYSSEKPDRESGVARFQTAGGDRRVSSGAAILVGPANIVIGSPPKYVLLLTNILEAVPVTRRV
jgi:hypothetical protein